MATALMQHKHIANRSLRARLICDEQSHWGLEFDSPYEILGTFLVEDDGPTVECVDYYIDGLLSVARGETRTFDISGNLCRIEAVRDLTTTYESDWRWPAEIDWIRVSH